MLRLSHLVIFLLVAASFPTGASSQTEISAEMAVAQEDSSKNSSKNIFKWVLGRRAMDGVLLGMWSLHLDGSGDITGEGRNNEHNILKGIQYYGFSVCHFYNSHDASTVYAGLVREIHRHEFNEDFRFDLSYKIGLLHGYGHELPNYRGISAFFTPFVSFTYKRASIDFGLVPVGVLTANFRYQI